ncbi:LysR family transcriptional regulator [Legionella tucsonensis]|uniref:LysR family transporter transcriptional regulator n=1 Tax=Legionella tucsonensis TaxID=40335 RepID=A0A0W0ZPU8_9GAMM|nr:LysR family transcriptional regulator [Legionella tucsonensis]KTD71181.1 LysR family transporter transcriptional regulator [Legionella tucsonensis]
MINNKLNLNDLAIFALVVKNRSFTQAALEAGISKAWVSQKISQMETILGIKLLNRTTRSLSLTLGGEILFEHCETMLKEVAHAENHLREYAEAPSGKLVITCPEISGLQIFPRLLHEFKLLYPQIRTHLIITDLFLDLTQQGIDFAFRTGKLSDSGLVSRYIGVVPRCLVASPEYLSKNSPIKSPEDLLDHQLLKHSSLPNWPLKNREDEYKIHVKNPVVESNSLIYLHKMACLDFGIAFLPYYLCSDALNNKMLIKVLPDWFNVDNDYYMVYHKDKSVLYINQLFKDFILKSDLKEMISR